jgi:hypothetical protein
MSSPGDLLRDEAKRRYAAGEFKFPQALSWNKAAAFLDETFMAEPAQDAFDIDTLADASRCVNVERNGHPMTPWAEIVDDPTQEHVVEIWRKRGKVLQEELKKAFERRRKN